MRQIEIKLGEALEQYYHLARSAEQEKLELEKGMSLDGYNYLKEKEKLQKFQAFLNQWTLCGNSPKEIKK